MSSDYFDVDDCFENIFKEQQYKKQKKLEKQERLNRKKELLNEIKNVISDTNSIHINKRNTTVDVSHKYIKGTVEWAFFILQSSELSSLEEIRRNYLRLAQKFHPDKGHASEHEMQLLNDAWNLLKTRIP